METQNHWVLFAFNIIGLVGILCALKYANNFRYFSMKFVISIRFMNEIT